ncbi:hypothetical protein KXV67_003128, partial [Aspergillus fumigatus]
AVIGTDLAYNNASAAEAYEKFPDFARKAVSARRRLAIVVSRISDGKSCAFPNYRGVGGAGVDPTSQATVSSDLSQNPLLWQVSLVLPLQAPTEFGTLQDGGVRANNRFGIAQEECRIIWPSAHTFDLLISVGTGYVPSVAEEHITGQHPRGTLQDRAPLRLWRACNSSPCMNGAEAFKEGLQHVPYSMRSRIFRLAHAVAGDLPQLDDIARLAELADVSYTVPDEVVQTVLATGFFFELDEAPMRLHGQYHSRGSALCARNQTRLILKRVLVEFPGAELQTNRGDCLGRVEDDNWCSTCGYYRKGGYELASGKFGSSAANGVPKPPIAGPPAVARPTRGKDLKQHSVKLIHVQGHALQAGLISGFDSLEGCSLASV